MPRTPIFTRPTLTKNAEFGVRDGTSQRLSFGPDGARGVRKIRVRWDQRYEAIRHYLGDNQIVYCDNVARQKMVGINRLTPLPWPDPQFSNLYANSVSSITGFKIDGHTAYNATTNDGSVAADYTHADIEIEYRPAPYVVAADNAVANGTCLATQQ